MYDYMCISPPMSHFPSSFLESTRHVHTHTCSLNPQLVRVSPANCPDHSRAYSKKMLSATAAPRWAAKKN